jgi:hypothetical protein
MRHMSSSSRYFEVSGGVIWKILGCMVACVSCGAVVVVDVVWDRGMTSVKIMDGEGEICCGSMKEGAELGGDL